MVIRKGSGEPFQKLMEILSSDNGGGKQQSMHVMLDLFMSLGRHSEQDVSGRGEHTGLAPKLRHYIDTHIAERFTLDDLAERFHLSKRQLIRIFKAKYGETPGAYHCRTRLVAASRYLARPECTVGGKARLGYCDQSFFHRIQKAIWNVSACLAGEKHHITDPAPPHPSEPFGTRDRAPAAYKIV